MELIKKNVHMNKLKCQSSLQLTLDDDFNVPDVKPDIYKIIKEQGAIKINDVKMLNGKLMVKGALYFNMLYLSDENVRPVHNMSGEVPFDEVVHLDEACAGDEAVINWELEDLTTGLINSRKSSVKAIVRLTVLVEELYDEATAVSIEGDDDIQFVNKNITVTDIAVDKKDTKRNCNLLQNIVIILTNYIFDKKNMVILHNLPLIIYPILIKLTIFKLFLTFLFLFIERFVQMHLFCMNYPNNYKNSLKTVTLTFPDCSIHLFYLNTTLLSINSVFTTT